jgi:formate dehydrogenase
MKGLQNLVMQRYILNAAKGRLFTQMNLKHFSQKQNVKKVVAVFYKGGEAAKREPRLTCTVENALGLKDTLKEKGIEYIVTDDKEGKDSVFEKNIHDADVIITTPFHPAYITKERLEKAKNLKLCLTAGIGSDHVDLLAAQEKGITVAEVTGCNVVSVAEHVVMQILALVRNYIPAYTQVINNQWDVAKIAEKAFDIEGKVIGTVGAGRIGQRVLERLQGFNCKELLYTDYARMSKEKETQLNAKFVDFEELLKRCDVVTLNCPLHKNSEHLMNKNTLKLMKKGSYLVNTARGKLVQAEDLVEALKSGHLAGYAGDVWYPQPAPADHVWRHMPNHAMTPHYSGTTLDAQRRKADGSKKILFDFMEGRPLNPDDVIVQGGKLAAQYDKNAKESQRSTNFKPGWEKLKH